MKSFNYQEYIAVLALIGIAVHIALLIFNSSLQLYPLYIVFIFGGIPIVMNLLHKLFILDFGSDLLAGISIVTSVFLGQYLAGALVVLMLSGGQSLENFAIRRASKALEALAKRAPTTAHRKTDAIVEDILVEKILIGDKILIFPHEICPVDGLVTEGNGVMDESYLTGEPFLIHKAPGSEVLSGAINGDSALVIEANKLAVDSRYARIMKVMLETEQKRPRMRRLADQLGAWYTPFALIIAIFAWILSGDAVRFLAVLVIATPCPLLIGIPVAIIGSISLCASRGILIKNPAVLEQADQCRTMIFDKTGTLTYAKPVLIEQISFNQFKNEEILRLAASLEKYSKHPLASAILEKAAQSNIELISANEIREPKGQGLQGNISGREIVMTSRNQLAKLGLAKDAVLLPKGKGLECVILIDGKLAGYYRFRDSPRIESQSFIQHLLPKHRIKKLMIVSGDRLEEVQYLAEQVGISEIYGGQSPEEKVEIVLRETRKAKTAYLGDGINDAPALIAATVGIAFGKNSDITAEAADAVVMDNSLKKVDEFLHISRRLYKIGLQSAVGGIMLSIIGMLIAAFGLLTPVVGAILQEVIDLFAIMNSLRTIGKPAIMTDMPFAGNEPS